MDEAVARTIRVRDAHLGDLQSLIEFNVALAAETESRDLERRVLEAGVRGAFAHPDRLKYWVAESDDLGGAVVGQAAVTREWSDWRNGWIWWFQSVYVDERARRAGVFRALHAHVREQARREPDVVGLRLYVEHENEAAQRTYLSLGFEDGQYLVYEEIWPEKFGGTLRADA